LQIENRSAFVEERLSKGDLFPPKKKIFLPLALLTKRILNPCVRDLEKGELGNIMVARVRGEFVI